MVPYVLLRPIGIKVIESLFPLVDSPNWEVVQMGARKEPNAKRTTKIVLLLSKLRVDLGSFKSEPHQDQIWWHPSAGYLSEIFSISSARRLRLLAGSFLFRQEHFFFLNKILLLLFRPLLYSPESTIAPIQLFEASFHSSQHCWKASVLRIEATNIQD